MLVAFYILSFGGLVGAYDVLYYHMYRARLWQRPEAMMENVTHAIRALLFSTFFFLLLFVEARGSWWWLYPAVCTLEMLNTMSDTFLEKRSREPQGGMENGEYMLHVFLSVMIGAVMACMLFESWSWSTQPTELILRARDVPAPMFLGGVGSIAVGLGFFCFEGFNALRMASKIRRGVVALPA